MSALIRRLRSLRGQSRGDIASVSEIRRRIDPDALPIRIAVIGTGRIAPEHLRVLASFSDVNLVGIANRSGAGLAELTDAYGIERGFTDWEQMMKETAPDGVLVLVDHFATADVAARCLELGTPCLVEKPAGFSAARTAELAAIAERAGLISVVGVNRRFYSVLQRALGIVLSSGPIQSVTVDAPEPIAQIRQTSGRSAELIDRWLVANTIHAIDLLRYVGGDVREIETIAHARTATSEAGFAALVRFDGGASGFFSSQWATPGKWRLQIDGVGVRTVLEPFERAWIFRDGGRSEKVPRDPVDVEFKPGFYAQDRAFIEAVGMGEPLPEPASDLHDAVKTMEMVEAIAGGRQ